MIERDLARSALADEGVKRLMTIPGIDMVVALAMEAAIGDVARFEEPAEARQLPRPEPERPAVGTGAGLPRADHQAGPRARPRHAGRGSLGCGASPGPLRAFFLRVRGAARPARRGRRDRPQARRADLASAAQGRELSWARPALHAKKLRDLELKAGHRRRAARKGPPTPTTSRATGRRSGAGSSRPRRPMPASSPAGTLARTRRCARAPQPRSDDKGCAAGLHLTPCSSPRGHPCATRGYCRSLQKALVDHTGSRMVGWGGMIGIVAQADRKECARKISLCSSIALISATLQLPPLGSGSAWLSVRICGFRGRSRSAGAGSRLRCVGWRARAVRHRRTC